MTNSRKTGIDKSMLIINTLKAEMGYKFVGVQGYCWGGTTAVKLAQALDTAHAFVAAHPGGLSFPKGLISIDDRHQIDQETYIFCSFGTRF